MKRMILAIVTALTLSSCGVGYYSSTYVDPIGGVPVTGSVNITLQPSWGPAGYDYAMYYYFPEFNFYYDVERALFHYLERGRWISAKILPRRPHFPTDLHRYYKVVINQRNPWHHNRQHKNQYKHYKGVYNQRNLRDVRNNHNDPRIDQPRRIHYQSSTPSRNNNTSMAPQGNPNRGQGSRGNMSQGQGPRGNAGAGSVSRPSSNPSRGNGSAGNVRPGSQGGSSKGSARPGGQGGSSSGSVRPGGQGGASKSSGTGSRSTSSQSSLSTGSRSTGSRGR